MRSDEFLRQIGSVDEKYVEELFAENKREIRPIRRRLKWGAMAACFALAALGSAALWLNHNAAGGGSVKPTNNIVANEYAKNSSIMIDVNPSIKLEVNESGDAVKVEAENDDAAEIVAALSVEGKNYKTAVSETVKALQEKNYITAEQNSVLITVVDNDEKHAEELRHGAVEAVKENNEANYVVSVLSQTVAYDERLVEEAEQYKTSTGRVWLIDKTSKLKEGLTEDKLINENIHVINQILEYINLPEKIYRDGSVAGTLSKESRANTDFNKLSADELISLVKSIDEFYNYHSANKNGEIGENPAPSNTLDNAIDIADFVLSIVEHYD